MFQSPAGDIENRLCQSCGADPSLGLADASQQEATKPSNGPAPQAGRGVMRSERGGKKHGGRYLMLKLFGGWLAVLVLIVLAARLLWPDTAPAGKPLTPAERSGTAAYVSNEDAAMLNVSLPNCFSALAGFLAAGTPEARNQFVLSPVSTAARMARFYSLNPLITMDSKTLVRTSAAVLALPGGRGIETSWSAEGGNTFDAVFREENGEWRIDWDHFARYGDYPWSLFLAGSGPEEGEFRLLARERLPDAHKQSDFTSIVFYAPRFGHPRESGFQSPEFLVPRDSLDGRLFAAAFKLAQAGHQVFGSKLTNQNPEDMIRVRVKIRRIDLDRERKFELIGLVACHWYAVDDPGVTPAPAPATNPKPADGAAASPAAAKPAEPKFELPDPKKDKK